MDAERFSNYASNRIWMRGSDGWLLADGNFYHVDVLMEDVGMFTNGLSAARHNGKWGLIASDGATWVLPPDYDDIIRDELGRAFSQNAVFVRSGGRVSLLRLEKNAFVDSGQTFEDAKPFADSWAAVKINGKWGFIDNAGNVQIDFLYDDAGSFGGHLAAVRTEEGWGYISLKGQIAIEPQFVEAKTFQNGSAPVRTEEGWLLIRLTEYEQGVLP